MHEFICSCGRTVLTEYDLHICGRFLHNKPYEPQVGKIINGITILKEYWKNDTRYYWCKCTCGEEFENIAINIDRGHSISCAGPAHFKDKNISAEKLFKMRYKKMIGRVEEDSYSDVKICNEWYDFENFKHDMYNSFLESFSKYDRNDITLDRIDPYGDYCKENCRWATRKVQNRNKRNTRKMNGKSIRDLSEEMNIPLSVFEHFYEKNKTLQDVINYWNVISGKIIYEDKEYTYYDFCKCFGFNIRNMYDYVIKGYNNESILIRLLATKGLTIYEGKTITIEEIAKINNISPELAQKRLKHGRNLIPCYFLLDGEKCYLTELSQKLHIHISDLRKYIKSNETIKEDIERAKQCELIEYQGKTYSIRELANMYNLRLSFVRQKLKKHPIEEVLQMKDVCHPNYTIEYNGEKLSLDEAAKRFCIPRKILRIRLQRNWSIEKALTQPIKQ